MARLKFNFNHTARILKLRTRTTSRALRRWWASVRPVHSTLITEDQPLHLELFSLDQLERHAQALAEKHEVGPGPGKDQLLLRLADNERVLVQAYEQLSSAVRTKERISPAAEWLLDNFHLIEE